MDGVKTGDLYPSEELYRLTALQWAWKNKDQAKADQYGEQIKAILEKYQGQVTYNKRILPLLNPLANQK
jgi:hypothetical protein